MQTLLLIFGAACFSLWFTNKPVAFIKIFLAKHKIWYDKDAYRKLHPKYFIQYGTYTKTIKPFDCEKCLSFWISLFTSLIYLHHNIFYSILVGFISYILSIVLSKLISN